MYSNHTTNYRAYWSWLDMIQENRSILAKKWPIHSLGLGRIFTKKMNEARLGSDRSNWKQTFFNFSTFPSFFFSSHLIYLSEQISKQMTLNFKGFECSNLSFTFWGRIVQFFSASFQCANVVWVLGRSFLTLRSHLCCCFWQWFPWKTRQNLLIMRR